MLGGGVDAATLVAASGAGPPPPDCRWSRRPHREATACRLLERDDRVVDGPGVEGDGRLGELLEVERDEGLRIHRARILFSYFLLVVEEEVKS